jgi:nucleoside-diphosphate-sugar epimerase
VLSGEKILLTGPAGQIAYPIARGLAAHNEVWGFARFTDRATRDKADAVGVHTVAGDLATGDFSGLPDDFTVLLHLAVFHTSSPDYDQAMRVNAEGTGLLMRHCAGVRAALIMSTTAVYRPNPDPYHAYVEDDPMGELSTPWAPTYSASKIAQEGVARFCARAFKIPTVITRMNASYGPNGGLAAYHFDALATGRPVVARWDPQPYTPIHEDDILEQIEPLLGAASVPATIVNWGGDEIVTVQEWTAYLAGILGRSDVEVGVQAIPNTMRGNVVDVTRRRAITGPCRVDWRTGFAAMAQARRPSPG